MRRILPLLVLVSVNASAGEPNWSQVEEQALTTLLELVQMDTSQPRGNEIVAARYLQEKFRKEGIGATIYEAKPGRASIVARLNGNGRHRPLLLLGHLDVVTVEAEHWSFDPFAGTVKDGKVLGRGSRDDKEIVAGAFQVLVQLHKLGIPLNRDVIFLGVADEESGGDLGITYLVEHHLPEINAEFAINEGGRGQIDPITGKYTHFNIGTAEKTPRRARLSFKGRAGHGSVPTKDNPIGVLARAVARIFDTPLPMRLNRTTRTFFERLAATSQGEEAYIYRAILQPNPSMATQYKLQSINPSYYSMIRTSVVPTIFKGGYQRNVILSEAEVILDIRALPGENPASLFDTLKRITGEPDIELIPMAVTRPAHPPSPLDTPLYRAFERVLQQRHPRAVILPSMNTGASDSAQLRAAGIPTYGFGPGVIVGEHTGVHGNDEYLRVDSFHEYLHILWQVVLTVVTKEQ